MAEPVGATPVANPVTGEAVIPEPVVEPTAPGSENPIAPTEPTPDPALDKARKEAIDERHKRQAVEARLAEIDAAALSDLEKAQKAATDAEAKAEAAEKALEAERFTRKAEAFAASKGFIKPAQAVKLLDETDEDGLEAALEVLKAENPHLVGATGTTGAGNGANGARGPQLTMEQLRGMTSTEVTAYKLANPGVIEAVMAGAN